MLELNLVSGSEIPSQVTQFGFKELNLVSSKIRYSVPESVGFMKLPLENELLSQKVWS